MIHAGVTRVRLDEPEARSRLESYIFGGKFGLKRVPRGIDPELVSQFIRERVVPESGAGTFTRTLDVVRFYERSDVVPIALRALDEPLRDAEDVRRACAAARLAGEMGDAGEASAAAARFDRDVAPHAAAARVMPALLETPLALIPIGSYDAVAARVAAEVARARIDERKSLDGMYAFDKISAFERNDLRGYERAAIEKARLAATPDAIRRPELVTIYLGLSALSSEPIAIWAARLLRREALTRDPAPVVAELGRAIDGLDRAALGDARHDFVLVRAAQAIVYLGGPLQKTHEKAFESITAISAGFLWDDP